jgi:hypothetical protein
VTDTSTAIVPADQRGTAISYNVSDISRMGEIVAQSGLFGIKTPQQAAALMLVAQAEGRHPASVAMDYHVIQGRPALKSERMLARFQACGGRIQWTSHTDQKVAAKFSHPQGGEVEIDWTMERAKAANLTGKENWRAYPRQMLRARVISEGVRACFPAACGGAYTPEEVQDFVPADEPRQVTSRVLDTSTSQEPEPTNGNAIEPSNGKPALPETPEDFGQVSDAQLSAAARGYMTRNHVDAAEVRSVILSIGGAERVAGVPQEKRAALMEALNRTLSEVPQ